MNHTQAYKQLNGHPLPAPTDRELILLARGFWFDGVKYYHRTLHGTVSEISKARYQRELSKLDHKPTRRRSYHRTPKSVPTNLLSIAESL